MAKTFQSMNEKSASTVMLVDALNLAFRYWQNRQTDFITDYTRTVLSLQKSYKAGKVIIVADGKGGSAYRKAIYPEYKQNRDEKRKNQSPEDAEAFTEFFNGYLDVLEYYDVEGKFPLLRYDGVEADDIGAYICKNKDKFGIDEIVLVSSDKDWDLLIADNIKRFSYVTRKETTVDNWSSHYDCTPEQYISIKCLQGDAGDNVPGVDGVGPVKALSLVNQYGSAIDIAAEIPISSKYKYIQNLNSFGAANLIRNYELMDLLEFCETAIGPKLCEVIDKRVSEYVNS